eukprot:jgi/Chrpa1/18999/Chrysochromulina_OHIO_Genome00006674-RA
MSAANALNGGANKTPALGWRQPIAFALVLLVDVLVPLFVGSICDPEGGCSRHANLSTTALVFFPKMPYYFGASAYDLMAAGLARAIAFGALILLRRRRRNPRVPRPTRPMLQPLNAEVHVDTTGGEDQAVSTAAAESAWLSSNVAGWIALAITALSWTHASCKSAGRLLSAGSGEGDGFNLLPLVTSPPEVPFWLCVGAAYVCSELERRVFDSLSKRLAPAPDARKAKGDAAGGSTSRGGGRTRGGNGGASMPKGDAELAAEQSAAIKKQYLEATEPKNMPTLRLLFSLMAPDTHLLALAYVSLILAAAGESLVPLLYGLVIDAIAINPQPEQFRKYMLYLILTAFLTGIFTGLRGSTFTVIGGVFGKRLRVYLFRALLEQELDFFGATKTGDITSRLSADCQKVADQVQLNVNVFLRSVIQAVFTLALMLFLSPKLALASFVIVPAIVGISKVFGDYMRDLSTETQDALAEANSTAEEVIGAISTTRAFSAEEEEVRHYSDGLTKYVGTVVRSARLYFFYSSLTFTFLPYLTYCLILFFAAQLIHTPEGCVTASTAAQCPFSPPPPGVPFAAPPGLPPPPLMPMAPTMAPTMTCEVDGPKLVSFVFYMQSLFAAFQSLGSIYTALAQALGAADKVIKWVHRQPTILAPVSPLTPTRCRGDVRLVDVHFTYKLRPDRPILTGLSLHAAPGEVVALCGPSGGGKSSIIALLERFYEPDQGTVLLDDTPIAQLAPGWFHRHVALVGQEPTLFARSLRDNICYGLETLDEHTRPDADAVVRAATLANAHEFISALEHGYDTFIGERGTQLSGGQKQRVAIARALVRQPAVLLLDEATSALDAESEHVVQGAIDSMIAQGGMTVLVIAHRLSTIRNADRILVINGGRVAEAGTHNELLARRDGEYAKLVHRQMAGGAGLGSQPPSQLPSPTDLASLGSAPTTPPPEPPPPISSKPSGALPASGRG